MAHGINTILRRPTLVGCKTESKGGIGSRRIFAPHFKLQVLDSYRNDTDCKGNQRATARKYGIHRRQIQKWLQCENNLRNSVSKVKAVSLEARKCEVSLRSGQHRQQDDFCSDAYSQTVHEQSAVCTDANVRRSPISDVCFQEEVRVPVKPSNETTFNTPLDYTIHCRSRPTTPEVGAPMDLSFKRTSNQIISPVFCSFSNTTTLPLRIPSPLNNNITPSESDIWDLSVKNQKTTECRNVVSPAIENQAKPVKLFKPYLDDLEESTENKLKTPQMSPCCNESTPSATEYDIQFYNNNYIAADYTYSLHELQPKNTINYYYALNKNYLCTPQCEKISFGSPYDNAGYLQTVSPPIKPGQCYSLDFKVSAVECYYHDSKGHSVENGMAAKFNFSDPFPKWLKREDELHIHDTNKFMHVVR